MELRGVFVGTSDLTGVARFYGQLLDRPPAVSSDEWRGFDLDGREVSVSSEVEDERRGGVVMVFEVMDAAIERERVARFTSGPITELRRADGYNIFLCQDPAGNTVEVFDTRGADS